MKTTDPRDPIDQQIDELLASRPLVPSKDFVARTVAAADKMEKSHRKSLMQPILRFALPLSAAAALALLLWAPSSETATAPASAARLPFDPTFDHDIFLLEEGLSGLAGEIEDSSSLDGSTLLHTLDALYLGMES
ncbi:MAG: hypothetical protein ACON46_00020 [Coraliomargaritaceae bacterium]